MIQYRHFIALVRKSLNISKTSLSSVKTFSTSIEQDVAPLKTVDLAYATYETQESKQKKLTPLIILHGMMSAKDNWSVFGEAINRNTARKVITIDARNHGDSPRSEDMTWFHLVADVLVLLKKLDITNTSILGHSMGGRTACLLALLKVHISDYFYVFIDIFFGNRIFLSESLIDFLKYSKDL